MITQTRKTTKRESISISEKKRRRRKKSQLRRTRRSPRTLKRATLIEYNIYTHVFKKAL